jgi:hypothetical protein
MLFILKSYLHILQETPAVLLPLVNNITGTNDNIFLLAHILRYNSHHKTVFLAGDESELKVTKKCVASKN